MWSLFLDNLLGCAETLHSVKWYGFSHTTKHPLFGYYLSGYFLQTLYCNGYLDDAFVTFRYCLHWSDFIKSKHHGTTASASNQICPTAAGVRLHSLQTGLFTLGLAPSLSLSLSLSLSGCITKWTSHAIFAPIEFHYSTTCNISLHS